MKNQAASLKILVTGASGFVGSHLARTLALDGFDVVALGGAREIPAEVSDVVSSFGSVDLLDAMAVRQTLAAHQPVVVVHAAALAQANACEENPALAERCNVGATASLLAACGELPMVPYLIFISTDLVFDGSVAPDGGFCERDSVNPQSEYAKSKVRAESLIFSSAVPSTALRIALVYAAALAGRAGFLGWITQSLQQGKPVTLFTDEWRTPLFAGDIAQAVARLARDHRSTPPQLLHLGGPERVTRYEFGECFARHFNYPTDLLKAASLREFQGAVPRSLDVSFCNTLIESTLGMQPRDLCSGFNAMSGLICDKDRI